MTEETQQQARVVSQEDQTLLHGDGRPDQIKPGALVARLFGIGPGLDQTVVAGAHQTVQVGVALLALDQDHQAARPTPIVGELSPQDGSAGGGGLGSHLCGP